MLIDVGLPAICVILPPAPSLLQEDSSDACVSIDALASAAERLRSNGLYGNTRHRPQIMVFGEREGSL